MTPSNTRGRHESPGWIRPGGRALVVLVLGFAACDGEPERVAPSEESGPSPTSEATTDAQPPGTDVWLGDLRTSGDSAVVSGLRNVTDRPGYDNQPFFLPDGSGFLYTVVDSTGQADIWRYHTGSASTERVTRTSPESEYSPTPLPWGDGFSVVRVEADSTQRLWRFAWDGGSPTVLFADIEPVGYHAWADEDWVALFVLGDPPTLRIAGGETSDVREVARGVGRSIQPIPGEDAVSFVQILSTTGEAADTGGASGSALRTRVMRWSQAEGLTPVVDTPHGGEDHAWTPSGLLLMGDGERILAWREGWERWRTVGRVPGGAVSRLAVSPRGDRLAVVVEPPEGG